MIYCRLESSSRGCRRGQQIQGIRSGAGIRGERFGVAIRIGVLPGKQLAVPEVEPCIHAVRMSCKQLFEDGNGVRRTIKHKETRAVKRVRRLVAGDLRRGFLKVVYGPAAITAFEGEHAGHRVGYGVFRFEADQPVQKCRYPRIVRSIADLRRALEGSGKFGSVSKRGFEAGHALLVASQAGERQSTRRPHHGILGLGLQQ